MESLSPLHHESYPWCRSPHWEPGEAVVCGRFGMVSTSHALASQVGVDVLRQGGNAVDAAVAVAAAMAVVMPCSNGVGGDAFALYYDAKSGEVTGVEGSGRAPRELTAEIVRSALTPEETARLKAHAIGHWYRGVHAVTVPGAAHCWAAMVARWGKLSLAEVLHPATVLAREGHPCSPLVSHCWRQNVGLLSSTPNGSELLIQDDDHDHHGRRSLRGPDVGEVIRQPGLARVLALLAERGAAGFYSGEVAESIVEVVRSLGGRMTLEDLAAHETRFCAPIEAQYRGFRVLQIPPPGQGIAVLLALNTLQHFDLAALRARDEALYWHVCIEATRLALRDLQAHVGDAMTQEDRERLLSAEHGRRQSARISLERAAEAPCGEGARFGEAFRADTICFSVTDREGNAVSFIQSCYNGFGTGIVPKGRGFSLHNRGSGFSIASPEHPNYLRAGGARPFHSIIPGMVLKVGEGSASGSSTAAGDSFYCTYGNMGGAMQPQGHVQLLSKLIDLRLSPKKAVILPRWIVDHDLVDADEQIHLEDGTPAEVMDALRRLGHRLAPNTPLKGIQRLIFGRAHAILRLDGVEYGACEIRSDGLCIALPY